MMHKLIWVDAFTDKLFGGNPCAVVFDADSLSDDQMHTLAREMNLSETAFIVKSTRANFGARYFTPAEEIPLAGHPTLSVIRALISEGEIDVKDARKTVTLELKAGVINVDIYREASDYQIVMTQKKPQFLTTHDPKIVTKIFGIQESDLIPGCPIQTVSTGTPQLMILVKSLDVLKKSSIDIHAYQSYKSQSDFFSPHLFCLSGVTHEGNTFARHLGVPPEAAEDAFTGSATGGMGAFLWHYGLITSPHFIAEQGHWMGRPGRAKVEIVGERENIESVRVGGSVVIVMKGEINSSAHA
ncbi:MAG: PhzF family phenazine biosynthesis protein [Xanthomonadaceae bacterium]|nr:PhzF family phenazine biosynthesis protein [Xanthomonadaceae bacterium]